MKYKLSLIHLFLFFTSFAFSQTAILEFDDQVCSYQGIYSPAMYNKKQLEDTYRLVWDNFYVSDEGTVEEVTARYHAAIEGLDSLEIVKNCYFQIVRDSVRTYLRQVLSLKRAQKLAVKDPSVLISTVQIDSPAYWYGQALVHGGDSLFAAYKTLVEQQMENNALPDDLFEEYQAVMKRTDREKIAFEKVLIYGWWNDANNHVDHLMDRRLLFDNYLKLFLKVTTIECEEI